jgi:hypothetical protein
MKNLSIIAATIFSALFFTSNVYAQKPQLNFAVYAQFNAAGLQGYNFKCFHKPRLIQRVDYGAYDKETKTFQHDPPRKWTEQDKSQYEWYGVGPHGVTGIITAQQVATGWRWWIQLVGDGIHSEGTIAQATILRPSFNDSETITMPVSPTWWDSPANPKLIPYNNGHGQYNKPAGTIRIN